MANERETPDLPTARRLPGGGDEQQRTVVHLARGDRDPDQLKEALHSFFGELADGELGEHVRKLQEREDAILAWLSEQPEELDSFVEDPLGALGERFPELELPRGHRPYVPTNIEVKLEPADGSDPVVVEIFQKLWEYVAASEANTQAFQTSPFSVIASIGAAYPPDKVDQVTQAFEAVFGIHRLATTAGVLDLAFAHARRP
jgi:hypothetical protein